MFSEHLKPRPKVWKHDRSQTVGASEIGQCARRTWYTKKGYQPEFAEAWGYTERGNNVEQWVYAQLRAQKMLLKWKQRVFSSTYLSCTLDGVYRGTVFDIKSYDPRKKEIVEPRHISQVQVGMGLTGLKRGLLLYVNASNYQDTSEVPVPHDERMFESLRARAERIMVAVQPPAREGVIAGGKECAYCVFQTQCLGTPVPERDADLSDEAVAQIGAARTAIRGFEEKLESCERGIAANKEVIREILRAANANRAPGLARIARSQRMTLNQAEMRADGIDVDKYRYPGREVETVTVE